MKKIGEEVSGILGIDQLGKMWSWEELRGQKVILYFYPKDDTPGCTAQACNLRDNQKELQKKGIKIVGVSADTQAKHNKFQNKYQLPFTLIADTEKILINEFGVWGPKQFMGKSFEGIIRTTFLISEEGKVEAVIERVKTKTHTEQILELLNQ